MQGILSNIDKSQNWKKKSFKNWATILQRKYFEKLKTEINSYQNKRVDHLKSHNILLKMNSHVNNNKAGLSLIYNYFCVFLIWAYLVPQFLFIIINIQLCVCEHFFFENVVILVNKFLDSNSEFCTMIRIVFSKSWAEKLSIRIRFGRLWKTNEE